MRRDTRTFANVISVPIALGGLVFLYAAVKERDAANIFLGLLWASLLIPWVVPFLRPSTGVKSASDRVNGILLISIGAVLILRGISPLNLPALLGGLYLAFCGALSTQWSS